MSFDEHGDEEELVLCGHEYEEVKEYGAELQYVSALDALLGGNTAEKSTYRPVRYGSPVSVGLGEA